MTSEISYIDTQTLQCHGGQDVKTVKMQGRLRC